MKKNKNRLLKALSFMALFAFAFSLCTVNAKASGLFSRAYIISDKSGFEDCISDITQSGNVVHNVKTADGVNTSITYFHNSGVNTENLKKIKKFLNNNSVKNNFYNIEEKKSAQLVDVVELKESSFADKDWYDNRYETKVSIQPVIYKIQQKEAGMGGGSYDSDKNLVWSYEKDNPVWKGEVTEVSLKKGNFYYILNLDLNELLNNKIKNVTPGEHYVVNYILKRTDERVFGEGQSIGYNFEYNEVYYHLGDGYTDDYYIPQIFTFVNNGFHFGGMTTNVISKENNQKYSDGNIISFKYNSVHPTDRIEIPYINSNINRLILHTSIYKIDKNGKISEKPEEIKNSDPEYPGTDTSIFMKEYVEPDSFKWKNYEDRYGSYPDYHNSKNNQSISESPHNKNFVIDITPKLPDNLEAGNYVFFETLYGKRFVGVSRAAEDNDADNEDNSIFGFNRENYLPKPQLLIAAENSKYNYKQYFSVCYTIPFKKVDPDDKSKGLAGAEFEVYRKVNKAGDTASDDKDDNKLIETATSDKDGNFSINMSPDSVYRLKETKAPDGYQSSDRMLEITFDQKLDKEKDKLDITVNIDGKEAKKYKIDNQSENLEQYMKTMEPVNIENKKSSDKEDPDRIGGKDRVDTANKVSRKTHPNGSNTVILTNKNKFSDVLVSIPLSKKLGAPILFTNSESIPEGTEKEIERLGAKQVYINGGTESVSKSVEDKLTKSGRTVIRYAGKDRYETSIIIAERIRESGNRSTVEIASGESFPDALSMSSLTVKDSAPILLIEKNNITNDILNLLRKWNIEKVNIAGQYNTISKETENKIKNDVKNVSRIGGKDRYETSVKIAAVSRPDSTLGVYISGEVFADALVAGPYAAKEEAPVLLVSKESVPESVIAYTKESKIYRAVLIGGTNTVKDSAFAQIKEITDKKQ